MINDAHDNVTTHRSAWGLDTVTDGWDWHSQGLCAQVDPERWFPEKGGSTREAKRICNGTDEREPCPVRAECLQYALAQDERFGIWGGYSERERRALKRGEPVTFPAPRSTDADGHGRYMYLEKGCRCDTCCEAHRSYMREYARAHRPERFCVRCGTKLEGSGRIRYCSKACSRACEGCGSEFAGRHRYCFACRGARREMSS